MMETRSRLFIKSIRAEIKIIKPNFQLTYFGDKPILEILYSVIVSTFESQSLP